MANETKFFKCSVFQKAVKGESTGAETGGEEGALEPGGQGEGVTAHGACTTINVQIRSSLMLLKAQTSPSPPIKKLVFYFLDHVVYSVST